MRSAVLVLVGAGPRTTSVLERLAANAEELWPGGERLQIHVVDPYPPGGGRIWRQQQSPLLWMNSIAQDVTVFTDESVQCAGPIVPGPSLAGWVAGEGREVLRANGLSHCQVGPLDFAPRQVQALYLRWAFDRVVAALPDTVSVRYHPQRATAVVDRPDGRQRVTVGEHLGIDADVVVLAQGYFERLPTASESVLAQQAAARGLTYLPPGYTADLSLDCLLPGAPVLVRGMGLAFVDLLVLLTQGRGGRFTHGHNGVLEYQPSGREPLLYAGSRRGIPYHAKLGYALTDPDGRAAGPVRPVFFTPEALGALGPGPLDVETQLWPLIVKELCAAHYQQLCLAHPDRVRARWPDLLGVLTTWDGRSADVPRYLGSVVADERDRFDLSAIDRPFAQARFASQSDWAATVIRYVEDDIARRADRRFSADRAVFDRLLTVVGVLASAVAAGQISAADRIGWVEQEFHGLFSFLASGPPPRRLAEMVALHRAGVLRFVGPQMQVAVHDDAFVAVSPTVAGSVRAQALVDARLPRPDVLAATDPVVAGMLAAGELAAEPVHDAATGQPLGGGSLLVDATCRAVRADRTVHPTRFLLGPAVAGSAGAGGFGRPGFNNPGFRQNDAVAREILAELAGNRRHRATEFEGATMSSAEKMGVSS